MEITLTIPDLLVERLIAHYGSAAEAKLAIKRLVKQDVIGTDVQTIRDAGEVDLDALRVVIAQQIKDKIAELDL